MPTYALGLDFGTESARAVLVNVATGETAATAVQPYADGVIDTTLPGGGNPLPPDWALQNPADWLTALEATVHEALHQSGIAPESVVGIGVDFTACTVLPATADGTPLCSLESFRHTPHAWAKLWKHHASQPQADRINELAARRGERWLARYGGKISSEWLMPKALQILEEDTETYAAAERIVEGGDWIVWQLTGRLTRNACAAGYKATWHKVDGYPSADFLAALQPEFEDLYSEKVAGTILAPGEWAGGLTAVWAERLGLPEGTPVAAAIIDAHAAVLGGGVGEPGVMFMIMGTSTCHMLMADREVLAEGISGVVEDGIVPGLFGYEAGQPAVGDIFAWFVENGLPAAYCDEAEQKGQSLHDMLAEKAAVLRPGESGLLALDWWNGNRSTLVDAGLSGVLLGCTLSTSPEEIYRALIEATALGTRVIIEAFTEPGLPVESIVSGGGLTKNALLLQIYADVTGREMAVAGAEQVSALGAAMLGAVAAGREGGGYDSLSEAVARMAPPPAHVYRPVPEHRAAYDELYAEYRRLYDYFGREANDVMKTLRRLRKG
jgi:L-ribulokinase